MSFRNLAAQALPPGIGLETLNRLLVELIAETGLGRQRQATVTQLYLAVDDFAEIEDASIGEVFDELAIRRRPNQMYVQIMKPMRAHGHTVAVGQGGDAAEFRDAPTDQSVGLQDRRCLLVQQFLEAPASGLDFA